MTDQDIRGLVGIGLILLASYLAVDLYGKGHPDPVEPPPLLPAPVNPEPAPPKRKPCPGPICPNHVAGNYSLPCSPK